jgi:transposase
MELKGVGPTTACALVASIGNAHDFKNGRQLAAWLADAITIQQRGKVETRQDHKSR